MVELEDNLWFHWNDVVADSFQGRLIHTADSEHQAPSWLGFGVYHNNQNYTALPKASDSFMTGSTCIIGMVTAPEEATLAQQYRLTSQSAEGISVVLDDDTSYSHANVVRHDRNDGKVITYLSFAKNLQGADIMSGNLRREGVNVFIWAVGPPEGSNGGGFGKHSMKGVIFLDLDVVQESIKRPSEPVYTAGDSDEAGKTAPTIRGQCGSSLLDGNDAGYVALKENLEFHWKLVGRGTKLQVALSYTGDDAWLGVAISPKGRMVGSSAVIGAVDGDDVAGFPPTHYNLTGYDISGVTADASVLLEYAGITSSPSSSDSSKVTTVLQFTRHLKAIPIADGRITFLYAVGASRELAYHEHRGAFQLNLEDCGGNIVDAGTWTRAGIFAAHGYFATVAWALATPTAVSVAWFRTLVPGSWIYIHVFGNVFTFLATLVSFILVVIGVSMEDSADHFSKRHHWVGLILFLLATFQVMNGFWRPRAQRKDNIRLETPHASILGSLPISRTPREKWQLVHRLSGMTAIPLGIYQIHSGLGLYSLQFHTTSMVRWFWLYVGACVLGLMGLRIWLLIDGDKARHGLMQAVSTTDRDEGMDDDAERETEMPSQAIADELTGTLT
jgi:hypothetical protein